MSNRETYKNAFEKVTMPKKLEKEILEMASKPKKIVWKSAISMAAVAAIICLSVFGGKLFGGEMFSGEVSNLTENSFSIVVHATENVPQEVADEIPERPVYSDNGVVAMKKIDFEVIGDNIKSVTFNSDDENVRYALIDKNKKLAPTFGNGCILDYNEYKGKFVSLRYQGGETSDTIPESTVITATATFQDGTTKTQELTVELK